jgi:hypothetical protein
MKQRSGCESVKIVLQDISCGCSIHMIILVASAGEGYRELDKLAGWYRGLFAPWGEPADAFFYDLIIPKEKSHWSILFSYLAKQMDDAWCEEQLS